MKKLGHLKTYKMKLTTLSPIFIGGGEFSDLSKLQYIYNPETKELKIIDEAKFMSFLKRTNLLDKFVNYVSNPQPNKKGPNLLDWINQNSKNKDLDIYKRVEKLDNITNRNLNYVRSFIKDKNGKPYIPGSSIKGAIKTALLANLIKEGLNITTAEEYLKEQMRFLHITDSKSQPTSTLMYRQTAHQQMISDENSMKKGFLRIDKKLMNVDNNLKEMLREGLVIYFDITIDNNFKYDLETLLSIISDFYSEVYEENKILNAISKRLKTNINVPNCIPNINIGGQSGFNTKVVLKVLSTSEVDYIRRKKEILSKSFKKHGHNATIIAPRCLRVVERFKENDKTLMPLGWCNISIAE
jgi:CRISPR-associated protein Csm5